MNAEGLKDLLESVGRDIQRRIFLANQFLEAISASASFQEFRKASEASKAVVSSFVNSDWHKGLVRWQNNFTVIAKQLSITLKGYDIAKAKADNILRNTGWWIQPHWTIPELLNVIESEGKEESIVRFIVGYFSEEELSKITRRWRKNEVLQERVKILEDAVWAHNHGKYTLTVPALLPQIEGMIADIGATMGIRGKTSKNVKKILNERRMKHSDSLATNTIHEIILEIFTITSKRDKKTAQPEKGRNPILHGHLTEYDSREFSLKLILLVDYLQEHLK